MIDIDVKKNLKPTFDLVDIYNNTKEGDLEKMWGLLMSAKFNKIIIKAVTYIKGDEYFTVSVFNGIGIGEIKLKSDYVTKNMKI